MESPWISPRPSRLTAGRVDVAALHIDLGGVPRGAVLVLAATEEADGLTATAMNRVAEQGYESVGIAIDPGLGAPTLASLSSHVEAGLRYAQQRGCESEQIGVLGFGELGAAAALLAAQRHRLGAAVSLVPGVGTAASPPGDQRRHALASVAAEVDPVVTPWLGLFGAGGPDARSAVPDSVVQATADSPVFTQTVVYQGVRGAFYLDCPEAAGHPAAFEAWQRSVEWLNLRVVPRATPLAAAWLRRAAAVRPTPVAAHGG